MLWYRRRVSSFVQQDPWAASALRPIPRGCRSLATAGLLFLALFSSSLKLHNDLPHGHDATPAGEALVFADARHPEAPLHLEASTSVAVRHCHTCLLQRDQVHGPLPVPGVVTGVSPTSAALGGATGAPRSQSLPQGSARAPPVV
jgi:hypothetical protein